MRTVVLDSDNPIKRELWNMQTYYRRILLSCVVWFSLTGWPTEGNSSIALNFYSFRPLPNNCIILDSLIQNQRWQILAVIFHEEVAS